MSRRARNPERTNVEAWAIPYGDLITLLLAFFVVMYAVSAVNEGRYRLLAESVVAAFDGSPRVIAPDTDRRAADAQINVLDAPNRASPTAVSKTVVEETAVPVAAVAHDSDRRLISAMADQVRQSLKFLIDQKLVDVRQSPLWLQVDINSKVVFASGSARLSAEALPVFARVADILRPLPNRIHVEGHTDDVPIHTDIYPSNWELSAARAGAVVQLLQAYRIESRRLVAVAYAQYSPLTDNASTRSRRRNRRVSLIILADPAAAEAAFRARRPAA